MKKKFLVAITIIAVSSNLAFGQFDYQQSADSFFEKKHQESSGADSWGTLATFSDSREVPVRAPIGSGWLLLVGMGLTYVFIRRKAKDERLKTND